MGLPHCLSFASFAIVLFVVVLTVQLGGPVAVVYIYLLML